jgi:hypothetical protein
LRLQAKIAIGPQDADIAPGDVVQWTDSQFGISGQPFLVMGIEEDKNAQAVLTLVEENGNFMGWFAPPAGQSSVRGVASYPFGTPAHTLVEALELPPTAMNGNPSIVLALAPPLNETNWNGAVLYVSDDNVSYTQAEIVTMPAIWGSVTAGGGIPTAPFPGYTDLTSTLQVQVLVPGVTLQSVTANQWGQGINKILVDGEIIYFQNASLVSGTTYNLTNLVRGKDGTAPAAHAANATFIVINQNTTIATPTGGNPLPYMGLQPFHHIFIHWGVTGRAVYFKAASVSFDGTVQPLSQVQPTLITYGSTGGKPAIPGTIRAQTLDPGGQLDPPVVLYGSAVQDVSVNPAPNRNLVVAWEYSDPLIEEDAELESGVVPGKSIKFDHYRVTILVASVVVRIEDSVATETYAYTEAKNIADNVAWQATVQAQIATVNKDGGISVATQQTYTMH